MNEPIFNFSREINSCERKQEMFWIPVELISQPEGIVFKNQYSEFYNSCTIFSIPCSISVLQWKDIDQYCDCVLCNNNILKSYFQTQIKIFKKTFSLWKIERKIFHYFRSNFTNCQSITIMQKQSSSHLTSSLSPISVSSLVLFWLPQSSIQNPRIEFDGNNEF